MVTKRSLGQALGGRFQRYWSDVAARIYGGVNLQSRWYCSIECQVAKYTLPEVCRYEDGTPVGSPHDWRSRRRPELLRLYREHVYGDGPWSEFRAWGQVISEEVGALDGLAVRREVALKLVDAPAVSPVTILVYTPYTAATDSRRWPLFLGLNFFGNHTVHRDPAISLTTSSVPANSKTKGKAKHLLRGLQESSWPLRLILSRGYGIATAYCGDIMADRPDGLQYGAAKVLRESQDAGESKAPWGAIAAWAWGLSRAFDCVAALPDVNPSRIAVIGHSRLGKAALWAGAQDERFWLVIANQSGCGGAALFRRRFFERIETLNRVNPHWFCARFKFYNNNEDALPVDQHLLIALIAPRPLYVASARLDLHADPLGEFLATKHAGEAYRLFGIQGLAALELPMCDTPSRGTVGYHIRPGGHGITERDWRRFIDFADMHLASADRLPEQASVTGSQTAPDSQDGEESEVTRQ